MRQGSALRGFLLFTCCLALFLANAVEAGFSSAAASPVRTADVTAASRPVLQFANATTQSTLGAAYTKALNNLLDVNTVRYDPATYNQSGLMTDPPGTFIKAGGGYPQPWTRDASVNSWNAASLLEPASAANTLWSVVHKQADGKLIVQQDNQQWDQVVWLTAAWNHYLVTGDRAFLSAAYETATDTLNARKSSSYDSTYGLFRGPAFFNDGIAGYPAPPADASESKGGFVGSYATDKIMVLSTNAVYYSAFRSAALMASALGKPSSEVTAQNAAADTLKAKINQYFWIPAKGTYGYLLHNGDGAPAGSLDQSEEGTGLSFAVLFGIADAGQAKSIMQRTHVQPHGIVDVYPHFARYSDSKPGRHNVSVWPMIQGYWADAAARTGDQARFASEVTTLADLANSGGGFYEIYNFLSGAPDGGWQTGGHWGPIADQTWSATAYLRMLYTGLFGLTPTTSGITWAPTLPWGWGDVTLSGLHYRSADLTVSLHGAGNVITAFKVDGVATAAHTISNTLSGSHTIDITLANHQPGTISGYAGLCLDVRNAGTANTTPVQTWSCNGSGAQQWTTGQADRSLRVLGKCLDVNGGSTANGSPVSLYDCNSTGAQAWVPQPSGALLNPQSGRCLEKPGTSPDWGTQLVIRDCTRAPNQQWGISS